MTRIVPLRATALCLVAALCIIAWSIPAPAAQPVASEAAAKPLPGQALEILKKGNARFATGTANHPGTDKNRMQHTARSDPSTTPLATILSCSDARVPVERIFDAGIGDLFVVRVPANVANEDQIAAVEYGATRLATPLVVVMGHTRCTAVRTAVDALSGYYYDTPPRFDRIIDAVEPAVLRVMAHDPTAGDDRLAALAEEENVRQSIRDLLSTSYLLRELVASGKVRLTGAIYVTNLGRVHFMDDSLGMRLMNETE
ncbi:MAG: carbonic anhydrase [Desulfatibacillaceae bacterium]